MHINHNLAFKHPIRTIEGYGTHIQVHLAGSDVGYFVYQAHIVNTRKLNAGKEGNFMLLGPARFNNAVGIFAH
jgi:hypothetical protein